MTDKVFFQSGDLVVSRYGEKYYLFQGDKIERFVNPIPYFSVIAEFDSKKCVRTKEGWEYVESFEVGTTRNPLFIPSNCEDTSYRLANEQEKACFKAILHTYGYEWDESKGVLCKINEATPVHTFTPPQIDYNGEVISPANESAQKVLYNFCRERNLECSNYATYAASNFRQRSYRW